MCKGIGRWGEQCSIFKNLNIQLFLRKSMFENVKNTQNLNKIFHTIDIQISTFRTLDVPGSVKNFRPKVVQNRKF